MNHSGLVAVFEESRDRLLRYFRAHGAGDAAEDCLQELWIRVVGSTSAGPIASPVAYLFRAATNVIIDRRRSELQARRRDLEWSAMADRALDRHAADPAPDAETSLLARQQLAIVEKTLGTLPPRALQIFRRHRIDGLTQREVATEMGVSASTIENDLRLAYRALITIRGQLDEE